MSITSWRIRPTPGPNFIPIIRSKVWKISSSVPPLRWERVKDWGFESRCTSDNQYLCLEPFFLQKWPLTVTKLSLFVTLIDGLYLNLNERWAHSWKGTDPVILNSHCGIKICLCVRESRVATGDPQKTLKNKGWTYTQTNLVIPMQKIKAMSYYDDVWFMPCKKLRPCMKRLSKSITNKARHISKWLYANITAYSNDSTN